jgi:PAS domain S-box-containing protein
MKRLTLLVVIMTVVATSVGASALAILYETAFEQQRQRLVETAKSQARLMEAVARFDRTYNRNYTRGARAATIEQIRDAHANDSGFGDTGEFTLAWRDGNDIVFLLRHRHSRLETPAPVPFQSDLAEPMHRALSGQSGTVVGPDYRGVTVLAAYEPVSILDLGIVAKIDLAEIRAPFLRAFGIVIALAITLITIGTILFYRVSNPMIRTIRESEERYRAVAEDTPVLICRFLPNSEIVYANESYCKYFGKTSETLVGSSFLSLIPEDNRKTVLADIMALTPESPTQSHEHQVVASDGEIRWQRWTNRALFDASGQAVAYQSIGEDITERKRAEQALRTSRERLRRLAARIEATREEERTAIAREVHDELGQALTGLKMDLAWLRDHLAKAQTETFKERLGAAEALANSTLDGMRNLAARLRPSLLDDLGLTAAIEWQVKEFAERAGCRFDLDLTDEDIGLDRERDTAVYRILQEALTNVARHARANRVTVNLEAYSDRLELIVADDGKGIRDEDIESVTSMGLTGMRERAGALGGQVDIRPRSGGGTWVSLRVPRSEGVR